MNTLTEIRQFWDADAATYDHSASHHPSTALARAAWARTLERLLPPPPTRVLDVGAGTGFLTLLAARLGHRVTALDLSAQMLDRLRAKATAEDLDVEVVEGAADQPPDSGFDTAIERHLVWTLPDPRSTLARWRAAAPAGRLVLLESAWGSAAHPSEALKGRARGILRLQSGTVVAAGHPAQVLTADLVARVFGVQLRTWTDPETGRTHLSFDRLATQDEPAAVAS